MHEPPEGYYVRTLDTGETQLWRIADRRAVRLGVTAPERAPGCHYAALPGETVWDAIRRATPWLDGLAAPGPFVALNNRPGMFHPRMARPVVGYGLDFSFLPDGEAHHRFLRSAQTQLEALLESLEAICRVVHPTPATLSVYGHEIRNLLILAATEVEMHMRAVLADNGVFSERLGTAHFVKLAVPMRLDSYYVRFHRFPELPVLGPFQGWRSEKPTKSLVWYEAYNGVKHNRDQEFERASLKNALSAVAACASLLVAQFGAGAMPEELSRFLTVERSPWEYTDLYVAPQNPSGWAPVYHPDVA